MNEAISTHVGDSKSVTIPSGQYKHVEEFRVKGLLFERGNLIGVYDDEYHLIPVNLELPRKMGKEVFKGRIRVKGVLEVIQRYEEVKVRVYLKDLKSNKRWVIHDTGWVMI